MVALDVTNPEAVAWFVYRLRKLQAETGIDGFKFDAGELHLLKAAGLAQTAWMEYLPVCHTLTLPDPLECS